MTGFREAIQGYKEELDCFVASLLAMTVTQLHFNLFQFSVRFMCGLSSEKVGMSMSNRSPLSLII
jgi:hypothetical protein